MVVDGLPAWAKYTYKAKETVAPAIGMGGGSILTRQNFTTVPRFMV